MAQERYYCLPAVVPSEPEKDGDEGNLLHTGANLHQGASGPGHEETGTGEQIQVEDNLVDKLIIIFLINPYLTGRRLDRIEPSRYPNFLETERTLAATKIQVRVNKLLNCDWEESVHSSLFSNIEKGYEIQQGRCNAVSLALNMCWYILLAL